jgi:hypothetical protein
MNPISEVLKENNKRLRSLLERLFLGGYKSYEIKDGDIHLSFGAYKELEKELEESLTQSHQNLISAFKEMVEEIPDAEIKITYWGEERKVKIKAKFTEDLLSSLTEETK